MEEHTPDDVVASNSEPATEVPSTDRLTSTRTTPTVARWWLVSVAGVALVLLAGTLGFAIGQGSPAPTQKTQSPGFTFTPAPGQQFTFGPGGITVNPSSGAKLSGQAKATAAKVTTGLVDITATLGDEGASDAGTGMVLTKNGLVLTNNHVIAGETSLSVRDIDSGTTYSASVVGYDLSQDVAVLQLTGASGLATVKFANSSKVKIGEKVLGIGNAGGVGGQPSVVTGTITGKDKSASIDGGPSGSENLTSLLASNADIEPGDSGGPLVNSAGKVVGMDTAAGSGVDGFSSSNAPTRAFSIPSNELQKIVKIAKSGKSSGDVHVGATGFLGIEVAKSGTYYFYENGSSSTTTPVSGAQIVGLVPGGPSTGVLSTGDVITSINGAAITNAADVTKAITDLSVGSKVRLGITTPAGSTSTVEVTLGSGPPQ